MFRVRTFVATTTLGLLLAGTAQALTADQVWARWQEAAAAAALSLTAQGSVMEGDVLRLTGVTVRLARPVRRNDPTISIGDITFVTQADGAVGISLPSEVVIPVSAKRNIIIGQDGLILTAREEGAAIAYDFIADRVTATEGSFVSGTSEGMTDSERQVSLSLGAKAPKGTISYAQTTNRIVKVGLNAASVSYEFDADDASHVRTLAQFLAVDDLGVSLDAEVPLNFSPFMRSEKGEFEQAMQDGLSVKLKLTFAAYRSRADKDYSMFVNQINSFAGSYSMSMDKTVFTVLAETEGGSVSLTTKLLPVPVNVSVGPSVLDVRKPIVGKEVQPFRFFVKIDDLAVDEEVWSQIDPQKGLPRDPADLELDLNGTASVNFLTMGGITGFGFAHRPRPKIETLNIPRIALSVAGAAFSKDVQSALARLVDGISRVEDDDLRDDLRLALSSIIVRVSFQDGDTRYAAVEKKVSADLVLESFVRSAADLDSARQTHFSTLFAQDAAPARIITTDILSISPDDVGPVDLAITSPPYPNAYEYWLYHKYRMYWLGFDPIAVREAEIGARPHFFKKNHHTAEDFKRQMAAVFRLLHQTLRTSGVACFVVADSRIHGHIVDNVALLKRAGSDHGFSLLTVVNRNVPNTRKAFNPANARTNVESIAVFGRS